MATDVEIERALATVTATLNDQKLDGFDRERVQQIVTQALGGQQSLTVDEGGGLHDETGARVGAVRRTDSGEWIADRQNDAAAHAETAIPTEPEQGIDEPEQSGLRKLLTRLKGGG